MKKNKILWIAMACCAVITLSAIYVLIGTKKENAYLQRQMQAQRGTLETTIAEYEECSTREKTCEPQAEMTPKSEIEKVLEPENITPDHAAKIDQLKKRYEDLLVSYFVLRKCEKVNPVDYHIITSSLSQEMASINAPGRLQYDILIAAKGSYEALYTKSSCDETSTATLYTEYKHFIDTVSDQFNLR